MELNSHQTNSKVQLTSFFVSLSWQPRLLAIRRVLFALDLRLLQTCLILDCALRRCFLYLLTFFPGCLLSFYVFLNFFSNFYTFFHLLDWKLQRTVFVDYKIFSRQLFLVICTIKIVNKYESYYIVWTLNLMKNMPEEINQIWIQDEQILN